MSDNSFTSESFPFKLKQFVKAKCTASELHKISKESKECTENVDEFYLQICSEEHKNVLNDNFDSDEIIITNEIHRQNKEKVNTERLLNEAMNCAQYNNVSKLKTLIEHNGVNVNSSDYYGWTLLMVASYAGSKNVVQYLLSKNARVSRRDLKGNTALCLASKNNHLDILDLLIKRNKVKEDKIYTVDELEKNETNTYFCEICNYTPKCSRKEHETSIVHLFKCGNQNSATYYGIPRDNIGFKMLLDQGWNGSDGLGPEGIGRKYPIKSREKNNRRGIGHKTQNTNTRESIKNSDAQLIEDAKHLNGKMLKQKRLKEKQIEKSIRKMLNEA